MNKFNRNIFTDNNPTVSERISDYLLALSIAAGITVGLLSYFDILMSQHDLRVNPNVQAQESPTMASEDELKALQQSIQQLQAMMQEILKSVSTVKNQE